MIWLKSGVPALVSRAEEVVKTCEERPEEDREDKETQEEDTQSGNKMLTNLRHFPSNKVFIWSNNWMRQVLPDNQTER